MTRLALPGKSFKNTTASSAQKVQAKSLTPEAEALNQVRAKTCYKALRSLVDFIQLLLFVLIAIVAVGAVGFIVIPNEQAGIALRIVSGLASLALCVGCAILVIAAKQAALLLVDIADCQIRQSSR
jgi:nitrate reductase NapE component